jgi:glycosyltransferase involved in cell wall biosynthesis
VAGRRGGDHPGGGETSARRSPMLWREGCRARCGAGERGSDWGNEDDGRRPVSTSTSVREAGDPAVAPDAGTARAPRPEPDGPAVDVVVPTYGRPRYLAETVESVLAQTLPSWRLTIAENGPGGGEVEAVLRPYLGDPRIRYLARGRNIGAARNAASLVAGATAPYVGLLHDDDLWDPEFLERRVAFLEANPGCGLVFSGCRVIDGIGAEIFRTRRSFPAGLQPRRSFLRTLYRSNVIYIPTVLVPRRVYDELGTFNRSVLFYDYEMWLRIATHFDVGYLPGWDAAYRVHPTQTTHREDSQLGELRLQLLDEMEKHLPPGFSPLDRRRARASALLHVSADALRRGEPRRSVAAFASSLRIYPVALADPKVLAIAAHALWRRNKVRQAWRGGE